MDQLDHLGWVARRSYEVGGVQFGVRTNSDECGDWLDETFSEYEIEAPVDPYYSIVVANNGGVGKRFHILYEESRALLRTHDIFLLGSALLAEFEYLKSVEVEDAVYAEAAVVRVNGTTALVPSILVPYLDTLGRRTIERSGLVLPVNSHVVLDPGSGKIVPTRPTLAIPPDALERLADVAPPRDDPGERLFVEEPLDVDCVCFVGISEPPVRTISPGVATHMLATKVMNLQRVGGAALEAVHRVVDKARCYEIMSANARQTLDALLQALRAE